MGLPVDRVKFLVYALSGTLAGLAGVILAAQFGAGQPTEGIGWELFAIASVVVGGTLLTGGVGSVGATLAGALLLGLLFNILNFENGLGWISLSAYWQSVIRGAFLLLVVLLQSRLTSRTTKLLRDAHNMCILRRPAMNLTLSIDDQTVEQARRVASAMNKSLNQVIREYLEQLARRDQAERDIAEFRALSEQHEGKSQSDWKWNRDEIYDRKIFSR